MRRGCQCQEVDRGCLGREWHGRWKAEWLHYGLISAITPLSRSISWGFPHDGVVDESSLRLFRRIYLVSNLLEAWSTL
jgi:hypothetical protein